jgi:diaminohydroxyphosphoribosylaminopyrimidine deaminase / 5-amino-6-(5-phosphoribosylamino)uracil reductase
MLQIMQETPWNQLDDSLMRVALRLARHGQGHVEPNPMVGAVICHNGKVVGKGFHRRFGGPHAEIFALKQAGRKTRGATLYVTLEPCCYTGKTGPCTEAIIAAGIRRVVAAAMDPNPLVAGKGFKRLRMAGIKVEVGLYQDAADKLNRPFNKWITTGRPWVFAKWAQTIDGCVADPRGGSQWISSPQSRQLVHRLRSRMDAIVVGIQTVLCDDPALTARPKKKSNIKRIPLRVVLDSAARLPPESVLVKTASHTPVLLVHKTNPAPRVRRRISALNAAGVQMLPVPVGKSGRLDWRVLFKELARRGCSNVLVEGGPTVLGTLLAGGFIDEAWVFIAPKIAGDASARHAVEGIKLPSIKQAIALKIETVQLCGPDVLIQAIQ